MATAIFGQPGPFGVEFDQRFARFLDAVGDVPAELAAAVRYAALAPGKRLRPYLLVRCCELVGGNAESAWPAAAAVECIHAFSLVHDDLPAMDDDDLRRGQLTTHRKFGEATAILAGDALVTLAFELIARHVADAVLARRLILELAQAAGWSGMIGGQAADLAGERDAASLARVTFIHERKTAALFAAACRMGAVVGGAEETATQALGRFGQNLGCAFQIADDLLDVTGDAAALGKAVGKDQAAGKQTYPRCVGIEQSRDAARQLAERAVAELASFGGSAEDLRNLARGVATRSF